MFSARIGIIGAAFSLTLLVGCVDRRFVVESSVPGTQIYVDGKPLGVAPVDSKWEYAGYYNVTALAPGYEPVNERVNLKAKWYQYPPIDLIAEVLWPMRIEDVRRIPIVMQPARPVNEGELIGDAERLRSQALTLPPSSIPDEKQSPNTPRSSTLPFPSTGSSPNVLPGNFPR